MAAPVKSAPVAAFLASVHPYRSLSVEESAEPNAKSEQAAAAPASSGLPPVDDDAEEGARAVLLTILSNSKGPVSDAVLSRRSEFGADRYESTIQELQRRGLVETSAVGHTLTHAGIQAAARERDRILSIW